MPNYYNPYYGQQMQMQQQMIPTQVSGGSSFVLVRNEAEARNYPVAYGNSVNFKDENAPYLYVKTMGVSQFDQPVFEKYRLTKEDATEASNLPVESANDIKPINDRLKDVEAEMGQIRGEIEDIKKRMQEVNSNDAKPERNHASDISA